MREKSFSMREKWSLMKQYKAAYLLLAPFMLTGLSGRGSAGVQLCGGNGGIRNDLCL